MITKAEFRGHSVRLRTSVPFSGSLFAVTSVTTLARRSLSAKGEAPRRQIASWSSHLTTPSSVAAAAAVVWNANTRSRYAHTRLSTLIHPNTRYFAPPRGIVRDASWPSGSAVAGRPLALQVYRQNEKYSGPVFPRAFNSCQLVQCGSLRFLWFRFQLQASQKTPSFRLTIAFASIFRACASPISVLSVTFGCKFQLLSNEGALNSIREIALAAEGQPDTIPREVSRGANPPIFTERKERVL